MNPIVSVIIPCYNKSDYLIEMIKCCQAQNLVNWELILVDDGSTEEEYNKVDSFISNDERVIHCRRNRVPKNGNTCRNIGLERSKGKYIIFFDSDDLISNKCLKERVDFMESHVDCDYATFPAAFFNDGDVLPKWGEATTVVGNYKKDSDILKQLLSYNYPFTVWSNIYRYSSIKNIRWDENVLVLQDFDWMLSCELQELKHLYSKSNNYDYYYRQFNDGQNVCGSFAGKAKCQSTLYLFNKILNILKERDDYELRKAQFFYYITVHLNRLIVANEFDESELFLEMCSIFYSDARIKSLRSVKEYYESRAHSDNSISPMQLYFVCASKYKIRRYYVLFLKNLVRVIVGKPQSMY